MNASVERPTLADIGDRFLQAQLRGDRRGACEVLVHDGLGAGYGADDLRELVREAQREIGRRWERNLVSIAQEHTATAIAQVALSALYDQAPRARARGRRIWIACVEGELHDLPARIAADTLDLAGYDVQFLGASVPTDSLLELLAADPPDLLALSVTLSFNVPALRQAVRRVREAHGTALPIAIGGNALHWMPGLALQLEVEHDADPRALAERLLGGGR